MAVSIVNRPPVGIARVDREVDEDLLHRRRIDRDVAQIGRQRRHQLHVFADQAAQQLLQLGHQRVDVHHLRLQHLPAAEREQLPGERRRAIACRLNLQQIQTQRILVRHLVEHQVGVAENRRQQVVEVVGDAAGQLSDCFHLLRLAQLLLELAAVGDVAHVDDNAGDGGIGQAIDAHRFHDAPAAVGVMEPLVFDDGLARILEGLGHPRADEITIVRVKKVEDRPAGHLLRHPAQMPHRRRAEIRDPPCGVDQHQCVGAVLDERAEALFARPQRSFRLPALPLFGMERQRVPDGPVERFGGEIGFAEIVGGARLHGLHRHILGASAREDDHRRVEALLADLAQQAQAVPGAQPVVEEGDVELARLERVQRLVVRHRDTNVGVGPRVARADELLHHSRMLERIVHEEAERFVHRVGRCTTSGERCRRFYGQARETTPRSPAMRAV